MLDTSIARHDTDGSFASLASILSLIKPDCVLHLASAPAYANDADQADILVAANIGFPVRLLEAMCATGIKSIVNTGTFWQHYDQSSYSPVDLYAATKQSFQNILLHYTSQLKMKAVTLKLYDNYGPEDPRKRIVTSLVIAAQSGQQLSMSPGDQILDLTHVQDIAEAFTLAAELVREAPEGTNEEYFLSGERITLKDLVAIVLDKSSRGLSVDFGARPYRTREIMDPIRPNRSLPGWKRVYNLSHTISGMLADE
jgi:nucleoside-diphosphate-sugar epimerase